MKRRLLQLCRLSLWALLLIVTVSIAVLHVTGAKLYAVQTSSMVPAFRPHDVVLVRPVATGDIKPGMIITYQASRGGALVSHRVIRVDQARQQYVTKGDALTSPDAPIISQQIIGQVTRSVPKFGSVLEKLRTPLGLGLLLYLPVSIIALHECRNLVRHYRSRTYRLYEAEVL